MAVFLYHLRANILAFFAVVISYYIAARLGLELASLNSSASPVWPATGIAFIAVLACGIKILPAIFLAAFCANLSTPVPIYTSLLIAFGNTAESFLFISLFNLLKKFSKDNFYSLSSVIFLGSSLIATAACSFWGVTALYLSEIIPLTAFNQSWLTWWIGDFVGALVITSLYLEIKTSTYYFASLKAKLTSFILIGIGILSTYLIFRFSNSLSHVFLLYPLILITIKFSRSIDVLILVLMISIVAIFQSISGHGLFTLGSLNNNLINLQLILLSLSITSNVLLGLKQINFTSRPFIMLTIGWMVTAFVFNYHLNDEKSKKQNYFLQLIQRQTIKIQSNFDYYIEALESGVSLIASSQNVSPQEWKMFVTSLKIIEKRPGINGMGVILPIQKGSEESFIRSHELNGIKSFSIKNVPNVKLPKGSDIDRFIITYIEPMNKNVQAVGLDVGSETNRRKAAEIARDTGKPTVTKKIVLVQDNKKGNGFLLYVPFYSDHQNLNSTQKRRLKFRGWVYAPFMTSNFFKGTLSRFSKKINFTVFEGNNTLEENIIYKTSSKVASLAFDHITTINLGQQIFTIGWHKSEMFSNSSNSTPSAVALAGILITLLIACFIYNLETTNIRANKLANDQTSLLRINEEYLKQSLEKSKNLAKSKSNFLANMSHEIRTPLNSIIGMAELLSETPLNPEQQKYLNIFKQAGSSLLSIINDILDLSKIESGNFNITKQPFGLVSLLNDCISLAEGQANQKNISLNLEYLKTMQDSFLGDPERIKQVLINIISNAVKFTPENGVITIYLDSIMQGGSKLTLIKIEDNGIGISQEKIKELFQPFVQADTSITKQFGGTGLGLAISKKLVELMSGSIWVESQLNHGSTFFITLDLEISAESPPLIEKNPNISTSLPKKARVSKEKLKILLVDDSDNNRLLIKAYLKNTAHQVIEAVNGSVAFEKFKQEKFDLVFMDMQMPILDGNSATRLIREWENENLMAHTPIYALTAFALKEEEIKSFEAGCDGHIAKPVKKQTILDIVNSVLK